MAVGTVGFSRLRNNASGTNASYGLTSGATGPYANQTVKGAPYGAYNLYINDTTTVATFPEYVGHENPAWHFLGDSATLGSQQNLHVYQYINKFKTMDLCFWGLGGSQASSVGGISRPAKNLPVAGDKAWGQWRDPNVNLAHIAVAPQVLLFPKNFQFSFSYENKFGNAWSKLSESGGLKKLSDALETARILAGDTNLPTGGKMRSRYEQVPMWEGCSPIKFDGSLQFEFGFGNFGLFSGEHEVVRPILALASMWAPQSSGSYMWGIAPTGPTYLVELIKQAPDMAQQILSATVDAAKNMASAVASGSGVQGAAQALVSGATTIEETLHNNVNAALMRGAARIKTVYFRIGRMIFGPLLVKGAKFSFDFTQTDEYGFPYKGEIELTGCEQIFTATPDMFVGIFDGITAGAPADDNAAASQLPSPESQGRSPAP